MTSIINTGAIAAASLAGRGTPADRSSAGALSSQVRLLAAVLLAAVPFAVAFADAQPTGPEAQVWQRLEPGLELGAFPSSPEAEVADPSIRVLRIDPELFELRLVTASAEEDGKPLSAKAWSRRKGLVAAINSSMYQEDFLTSVSLMRTRDHTNNPRLSKDMTVLAFDPLDSDLPPVRIIDRECDDFEALKERYGTLVQSIRMVSCKGRNVWAQQPKRWSAASIGIDGDGRVLFIHARNPISTHDLIETLKALPIDLDRAMYVEGGPEAQLFVGSRGGEHEFVGSYESTILQTDGQGLAWPVPNVVGIVRRDRATE